MFSHPAVDTATLLIWLLLLPRGFPSIYTLQGRLYPLSLLYLKYSLTVPCSILNKEFDEPGSVNIQTVYATLTLRNF